MAELIKISELASRAGVEKSTIQHYIREGLIPQPENRPHRNMHYYRADLVDRIKLIKDLQQRRNFPLSKIREVLADEHLADERGIEQIKTYLYSAPAPFDLSHAKPISRAKLVEESGITADALDKLEERHFITSRRKGTTMMYDPVDVAIVHACASMQHAGLNETNGFTLDSLNMYLVAMRELISKEMLLFARILQNHSREAIVEMAQRGFEGTNTLILNIRRKMFLKVLGDARQWLRQMEGKPTKRKQEE